jgi:hypothetical protein
MPPPPPPPTGPTPGTLKSFGMLNGILQTAIGYVAGISFDRILREIMQFATSVVTLAARYETLGVVVDAVGNHAGMSDRELRGLEATLRRTGISAIGARQAITRMIETEIALTNASKLARVAQDAAVIGNINSTEAFERLTNGIATGQVRILRTLGIIVNFDSAYSKLAGTLGKTADNLSEQEKAQARVNAVLEAGTRIQGSYESAMGTAGKQMLSATRYMEDLKVEIGTAFLPAYTMGVFAYTGALKTLAENIDTILALFAGLAAGAAVRWLSPLISGVSRAIDSVQGLAADTFYLAEAQAAANGAAKVGFVERFRLTAQAAVAEYQRAKAAQDATRVELGELRQLKVAMEQELIDRQAGTRAIEQQTIAIERKLAAQKGERLTGTRGEAELLSRAGAREIRETKAGVAALNAEIIATEAQLAKQTMLTNAAFKAQGLIMMGVSAAGRVLGGVMQFIAANWVTVAIVGLTYAITKLLNEQTVAMRVQEQYGEQFVAMEKKIAGAGTALESLTIEQRTAGLAVSTAKMQEMAKAAKEAADGVGQLRVIDQVRMNMAEYSVEGLRFLRQMAGANAAFRQGKIDALGYVNSVDKITLAFPQYAKFTALARQTGVAAATMAEELRLATQAHAEQKTELDALTPSYELFQSQIFGTTASILKLRDAYEQIDGAPKDIFGRTVDFGKPMSDADASQLKTALKEANDRLTESEDKLSVARQRGMLAGEAYGAAQKMWSDNVEKAAKANEKGTIYVGNFTDALNSEVPAARKAAQAMLESTTATTNSADASSRLQAVLSANKSAIEDAIPKLRLSVAAEQQRVVALRAGSIAQAEFNAKQARSDAVLQAVGKTTGAAAAALRGLTLASMDAKAELAEVGAEQNIQQQERLVAATREGEGAVRALTVAREREAQTVALIGDGIETATASRLAEKKVIGDSVLATVQATVAYRKTAEQQGRLVTATRLGEAAVRQVTEAEAMRARELELLAKGVAPLTALLIAMGEAEGRRALLLAQSAAETKKMAQQQDGQIGALQRGEKATRDYAESQTVAARASELLRAGWEPMPALLTALSESKRRATIAGLESQSAFQKETVEIWKEVAALDGGTEATRALAREKEVLALVNGHVAESTARAMVQEREAATRALKAAQDRAQSMRDIGENLMRGLQSSAAGFFSDLMTDGIKRFTDFTDSVKKLFIQMFAELAAKQMMRGLVGSGLGVMMGLSAKPVMAQATSITSSAFGGQIPSLTNGALPKKFGMGSALGAIGGGLAAGALGASLMPTKGGAALVGAAGGAAMGAAVGGVPGAIIGGLVGGISGWFGAAKKAKEAARAMAEAQKAFALSMEAFTRTASGTDTDLAAAIRQSKATVEQLLKEVNAAYSGKKNETVRNQKRREIVATGAQDVERLKEEFRQSIENQIATLSGNEAMVKRLDIEKAYRENLLSATAAGMDAAKVTQLYELQLKKLNDEIEAEARRVANLRQAFESGIVVRENRLKGNAEGDRAAYAEELAQSQREEIARAEDLVKAGDLTAEMLERLKKLLGEELTEAMRRYDEEVARAKANMMDELRARQLDAQGRNEEAAQLRRQAQYRAELVGVTDAAIRAEIERTQAIEEAAIVAAIAKEKADARQDNELSLAQREAALSKDAGRIQQATIDGLKLARDRELEAAREQVKQGKMSEEQFRRLAAVLEGELANAIERLRLVAEDAAKAFAEDMELRRLDVRDANTGESSAARRQQIQFDRELRQAVLDGRSDEEIRQIKYVQEFEKMGRIFGEETAAQLKKYDEQISVAQAQLSAQETIASAAEQTAQNLREQGKALRAFVDSLRLSGASPENTLALTQAQYEKALASGDVNSIQSAATAYINAAREYFGSSASFQTILNKMIGTLDARSISLESQAVGAQASADAMRVSAKATEALILKLTADAEAYAKARQEEWKKKERELEADQKTREAIERLIEEVSKKGREEETPTVKVEVPAITLPSIATDLAPLKTAMDAVGESTEETVDGVLRVGDLVAALATQIAAQQQSATANMEAMNSRIVLLAESIRGMRSDRTI